MPMDYLEWQELWMLSEATGTQLIMRLFRNDRGFDLAVT